MAWAWHRVSPATWAEARDWARRTTDRAKGVWGHCFYELATREFNLLWFSMYLSQAGGDLFNKEGTQFTLNTGPGQEALQFVVDLLQTDRTAVPPEQIDDRINLIKSGKVATWWRPCGWLATHAAYHRLIMSNCRTRASQRALPARKEATTRFNAARSKGPANC